MNMSRIRFYGIHRACCAALVAAVGFVLPAGATDVPDGGALTINDALGGADVNCKGSATLTVSVTKKGGLYTVKNLISAMAGTVTVDLSACADAPVLFTKDFRANASGHVIFTGGTKVLLGSATPPVLTDSATVPPKFGFAALEGPDGFSVTFTNAALLAVAMPANVSWSVAPGANILVVPENGLAPILGSGDAISLADFDVNMISTNAFPASSTVTVPAGCTLSLKAMDFNASTWAISTRSGAQFPQNFVLADESSMLLSRCTAATRLSGVISGSGSLRVYEGFKGNTILCGVNTFTGPIILDSPDTVSLELSDTASLLGGNEIRIYGPNAIDVRGNQTLARVIGETENSRVRLCTKSTVTINRLSGIVSVVKYAASVSGSLSATLVGADEGAVLCYGEGEFPVEVSDSIAVPRVDIRRTPAAGTTTVYALFGEDKAGLLPKWADDDALDVLANAGTSVNIPIARNEVALAVADGAKATVERISVDIAAEAYFWLDASVAASAIAVTNGSGEAVSPYVQEWMDCRSGHASPFLFNYRCYENSNMSTEKNEYKGTNVTQPKYGTETLNGLTVMDLSANSQRILSACNGQYSKLTDAKFCVMVFGSSTGGGKALLATTDGAFSRGTSTTPADYADPTKPITTNGAVNVWLNGTKVDPSKTGLSGAWDIVSVDTAKLKVNGLGFGGTGISDAPGRAKYAEVIFFNRVLSDAERVSVERYLAKKWGLQYAADLGHVTLFGRGTVELSGTIPLSGGFAGSLEMADDAEIVCGTNLPPTDAAIAAIPGRVRWMDPEAESTVTFSKQASRPKEVTLIADRTGASEAFLMGNNVNATTGSIRAPWLSPSARGIGPQRNWLDYSNIYKFASGDEEQGGNYLKFSTNGEESGARAINIRSAFIISDSSRGGGTPLLDSAAGVKIKNRSSKSAVAKASDPIWKSDTDATVTGGTTYLNGRPVDGTKSGFTGMPELFAFETTADLGISHVGGYNTTEQTFGESYGEFLGESIFFDSVLSEGDRRQVEAYLMWKWLYRLPAGYDNFAAATISGSGRVASASLAGLPALDAAYSGAVAVTGDVLDFGFSSSSSSVSGALIVPDATLSLAGEVTVNVHVDGRRVQGGKYTLVDVKAIEGSPVFRLNLIGDVSETVRESVSLVVEGGRVSLVRVPAGMLITVD